ncbi:hypothetical protein BJY01DRAFT_127220 [Aspergillus pseudoustus]|uniref:Uncharacterized protein n=1 Tax=Aspergillus pseudoustus TaxID=1810923 RepID=A0ABR4IPW5_9EURO
MNVQVVRLFDIGKGFVAGFLVVILGCSYLRFLITNKYKKNVMLVKIFFSAFIHLCEVSLSPACLPVGVYLQCKCITVLLCPLPNSSPKSRTSVCKVKKDERRQEIMTEELAEEVNGIMFFFSRPVDMP